MPTYSFKCSKCENIFQSFESIMFEGELTCPECGAPSSKTIARDTSVKINGSGFYQERVTR